MKLKEIVFLLVIALCVAAVFGFQDGKFKHNLLVKKIGPGTTTAQQDTFGGRTTLGSYTSGWGRQADTTWSITATAKDTSRVYPSAPYMSFDVLQNDAAEDSADMEYKIFMSPARRFGKRSLPALSDFVLIDSLTVSGETRTKWIFTESSIPNWDYWYMTVEGTNDNSKATAATSIIGYRSYE